MLINIKHYKNVPNNYDAFKERIDAKIGQDATARKCIKTYAFVFTRPKLQISRKKSAIQITTTLSRMGHNFRERRKDAKIETLLFYLFSIFLSVAHTINLFYILE